MVIVDSERFQRAIEAFERANAGDPNSRMVSGEPRPRELVDAERLAAWVLRLEPNASEALQLAARCQHIRRFEIPRESFPAGRVGYLQWRTRLSHFHADTAARLLAEAGYDSTLIDAVRRINRKQNPQGNPDTQTMEDALCLSFLEFEFEEFCAKHAEEKLVQVVQKTWKKMSARGHELALGLPFSAASLSIVQRALGA